MNTLQYTEFGLVSLVAIETSYLTWRSRRQVRKHSKFDQPIFVDTSVLMDGRIVNVAKTGFITGELVIPRSVILELQLLADKSDHDKRERARFGLDVVAQLQALDVVRVRMHHDDPARRGVDERLLELARQSKGLVLTLDYNLQKVAVTENIKVLNLNELASQLRLEYLPGERLSLAIVEKGSDSHQGIGYLADGTMVVVEHASNKIGKTEAIEIIRSLQTSAGKMCFAKLVNTDTKPSKAAPVTKQLSSSKTKTNGRKPVKTSVQEKQASPAPKAGAKPQKAAGSRPKTSKQREASLLRTIENQIDA